MSSLAAAQADGYYLPSEYYDSGAHKKQSKNQWWQQQQRKDHGGDGKRGGRAGNNNGGGDGSNGGSVFRFELPYSGFCSGCGEYVGKGSRFNAEKVKTDDSYFTTPILEFRMKCRHCAAQIFVIRTDPANRGFAYVSGIRQKLRQQHHQDGGDGIIAEDGPDDTRSEREKEKDVASAFERLEKAQAGMRKAMTESERMVAMQKSSDGMYRDDATNNSKLRSAFRVDRRKRKRAIQRGQSLGWRRGMALVDDVDDADRCEAQSAVFGNSRATEQKRLSAVRRASIFSGAGKSKRSSRRKRETKSTRNLDEDASDSPFAVPDNVQSVAMGVTGNRRRRRRQREEDIPTVDLTSTLARQQESFQCSTCDADLGNKNRKLKKKLVLHQTSGKTALVQGAADTDGRPTPTDTISAAPAMAAAASTGEAASALEALQSYYSSSDDGSDLA